MKKNVLLIVTNFASVGSNNSSYLDKERDFRENLELNGERIRFFHQRFQSKTLTLTRILREEKDATIHVMFQREIPPKKSIKVIHHVTRAIEEEKVIFSSMLN